jgi:hypothetical protein
LVAGLPQGVKALFPRLVASACWAAVVIGGLFLADDLPTGLNVVLFSLPPLAFGYWAGRWWPLVVPWVAVVGLTVISLNTPCDSAMTADGCGDYTALFAFIVFFAPLATAGIGAGVIGRKVIDPR